MSWVQQFFATSGLSRLATLQALGGFMMLEPLPELILMLSLASTNWAPNEVNSAPTQSIASVVCPIGSPTGKPALCSCSPVLRYVSQGQAGPLGGSRLSL